MIKIYTCLILCAMVFSFELFSAEKVNDTAGNNNVVTQSQSQETPDELINEIPLNIDFELVYELYVNNSKLATKPTTPITMKFVQGDNLTASGFAGVNQYNVLVTVDKEQKEITFSTPRTTRMVGPAMDYESDYLKELSRVKYFRYAKRKLTLLDSNMKTVGVFINNDKDLILDLYNYKKEFSNAKDAHEKSYNLQIGIKYRLDLDSLQGVSQKAKDEVEKAVTLGFANDGVLQAVGTSGLNLYFAKVEKVDEKTGEIQLNNSGMTLMAGPGADFEAAYLKALNNAKKYYYQDDKFILLDADDKVILIFNKGAYKDKKK